MIKKVIIGVLTLTLLLTFVSCQGKKQEVDAVRIGFFPNITHSQALYSKGSKQFEKEFGSSVKVDYKTFNSGPAQGEAILADEIDIGYTGPAPAINLYEKTKGKVKILASASSGGAMIVTSKESSVNSIKDLAGKKISVPGFGNTQDLCLRSALKDNNLESTTNGGSVSIIQANNQDVKALLKKGDIDAAIVPEPWGSLIVIESGAKVVAENKDFFNKGDYPIALIVAREDFIKKNPQIVEKFLKAHIKATEQLNNNKEETKKIVNKELEALTNKPLDSKVLDKSFENIKFSTDIDLEVIKGLANLLYETEYQKKKPNVEEIYFKEIIDKLEK